MDPLVVNGVLGGLVVAAVTLLARTKYVFLAGLLPLFPTLTLMSHWVVGTTDTPEQFREVVVFGMWAIVPYLAYLAAVYHLHARTSLGGAVAGGLLAWSVAAGALVWAWQR